MAIRKRLSERLADARIGDPMDKGVSFGPMVSENQMNIALSHVEKGKAEGARLVYGGARIESEGFYMQPTVFTELCIGLKKHVASFPSHGRTRSSNT